MKMSKKTYISPAAQVINLEPLKLLSSSPGIDIDKDSGIDNADQIRSNKFEWEDRSNYWDEK